MRVVTYLECRDDGASKFWEIAVDGAAHTIRFGKIGAADQSKTKTFSSPAEARSDAESLVAAKRKSGYREPGALDGAAPRAASGAAPSEGAGPPPKKRSASTTSPVASADDFVESRIPLLVRVPLAAGGGRLVVTVGDALVSLTPEHGVLTAEVVTPNAQLDRAAPATTGNYVFYVDSEGAVHACERDATGWRDTVILKQRESTPIGQRGLAAVASKAGVVWVAVVAGPGEHALLSNRSGIFKEEFRWPASGRKSVGHIQHFLDVAMDGETPMLAFLHEESVQVARFESGQWRAEEVQARAGGWVSMAIDDTGGVHVAYLSWTGPKSDHLEYARRTAEGWQRETVDQKGNAGYAARLLLGDGGPTIVYATRATRFSPERAALTNSAVRVARRTTAGWQVERGGDGEWTLAPMFIGGALHVFSGPAPLEESTDLRAAHRGPPPHPKGQAVHGAPVPKVLLFGGLKDKLRRGEAVHLEHGDRFWEITVAGTNVSVRSGKVGATGSVKTSSSATAAEALASALKVFEKKYHNEFFQEPAVAAVNTAHVDEIMSKMRNAARASLAADAAESEARQASTEKHPLIWDTLGDGGPLLGRLRGVIARGEIRRHLSTRSRIYFKATDPHFVFRAPVPSPLPDSLTNLERQLVVSKRLAEALKGVEHLEAIPIRLLDPAGNVVSTDYMLLEVQKVSDCIESPGYDPTGYYFQHWRSPRAGKDVGGKLPPMSRASHTLLIACNRDVATLVREFTGVRLQQLAELDETFWPPAPTSYLIARAGDATEFELSFESKDVDFEKAFDTGEPLASRWPTDAVMTMTGNKSYKKITPFMKGPGVAIVDAAAKKLVEGLGSSGLEFLPVALRDHKQASVPGDYYVMHITGTQPYVDLAESDIEHKYGYLWTIRELVVDEGALPPPDRRPAFFRVPGARFPWIFVRTDVVEAAAAHKLEGLSGREPAKHAYPTESGGVPKIC